MGRHGADLYVKKDIALVEALCGFTFTLPKLDGRTLVVKTNPGDVTKYVTFDPLKGEEGEDQEWETFSGYSCSLEDMAKAETTDLDMMKKAVSKGQLKGKRIGCFVIKNDETIFK